MSRFTSRLRDIIDTLYDGNAARFAGACGIDQGTLSRLLRGKVSPAATSLETMAKHLPTDQSSTLCAAWLSDLVPPQLMYAITIRLSDEPSAMIMQDAQRAAWDELDRETKSALDHLAGLAMRSPEARAALVSTAAFLRGEPVLSIEAETAVNLASAKVSKARPTKPSTRK